MERQLLSEVRGRRKKVQNRVISWSKENPRELPWRGTNRTPYKILVAEVLLKRTTTTAALRVYGQVIKEWPDIKSLSNARVEDLEKVLSTIGLQRQRAKGLCDMSGFILKECGGRIPSDYEGLLKVPHIGPYVAGTVMSFGFGHPAPILDSNVERVIKNVFADHLPENPKEDVLLDIVKELGPQKDHEFFNWGLVDLGWAICTYRERNHSKCPLNNCCDSDND